MQWAGRQEQPPSNMFTSDAMSWQTGTTPSECPINIEIMAVKGRADESRYLTDTAKLKYKLCYKSFFFHTHTHLFYSRIIDYVK